MNKIKKVVSYLLLIILFINLSLDLSFIGVQDLRNSYADGRFILSGYEILDTGRGNRIVESLSDAHEAQSRLVEWNNSSGYVYNFSFNLEDWQVSGRTTEAVLRCIVETDFDGNIKNIVTNSGEFYDVSIKQGEYVDAGFEQKRPYNRTYTNLPSNMRDTLASFFMTWLGTRAVNKSGGKWVFQITDKELIFGDDITFSTNIAADAVENNNYNVQAIFCSRNGEEYQFLPPDDIGDADKAKYDRLKIDDASIIERIASTIRSRQSLRKPTEIGGIQIRQALNSTSSSSGTNYEIISVRKDAVGDVIITLKLYVKGETHECGIIYNKYQGGATANFYATPATYTFQQSYNDQNLQIKYKVFGSVAYTPIYEYLAMTENNGKTENDIVLATKKGSTFTYLDTIPYSAIRDLLERNNIEMTTKSDTTKVDKNVIWNWTWDTDTGIITLTSPTYGDTIQLDGRAENSYVIFANHWESYNIALPIRKKQSADSSFLPSADSFYPPDLSTVRSQPGFSKKYYDGGDLTPNSGQVWVAMLYSQDKKHVEKGKFNDNTITSGDQDSAERVWTNLYPLDKKIGNEDMALLRTDDLKFYLQIFKLDHGSIMDKSKTTPRGQKSKFFGGNADNLFNWTDVPNSNKVILGVVDLTQALRDINGIDRDTLIVNTANQDSVTGSTIKGELLFEGRLEKLGAFINDFLLVYGKLVFSFVLFLMLAWTALWAFMKSQDAKERVLFAEKLKHIVVGVIIFAVLTIIVFALLHFTTSQFSHIGDVGLTGDEITPPNMTETHWVIKILLAIPKFIVDLLIALVSFLINLFFGTTANLGMVIFGSNTMPDATGIADFIRSPFGATEWEYYMMGYKALAAIAVALLAIAIGKMAFEFVLFSGNFEKITESKQTAMRIAVAVIGIVLGPYLFQLILGLINYLTMLIPLDLESVDIEVQAVNVDPIMTIVNITAISVKLKIVLAFVTRKIMLSVMLLATPIVLGMWAISPKFRGVKLWLGELVTNAATKLSYALVFMILIMVTSVNSSAIYKLVALLIVMKLADFFKDSLQGLFEQWGGIDETAVAGEALGTIKSTGKTITGAAGSALMTGAKLADPKGISNKAKWVNNAGALISGNYGNLRTKGDVAKAIETDARDDVSQFQSEYNTSSHEMENLLRHNDKDGKYAALNSQVRDAKNLGEFKEMYKTDKNAMAVINNESNRQRYEDARNKYLALKAVRKDPDHVGPLDQHRMNTEAKILGGKRNGETIEGRQVSEAKKLDVKNGTGYFAERMDVPLTTEEFDFSRLSPQEQAQLSGEMIDVQNNPSIPFVRERESALTATSNSEGHFANAQINYNQTKAKYQEAMKAGDTQGIARSGVELQESRSQLFDAAERHSNTAFANSGIIGAKMPTNGEHKTGVHAKEDYSYPLHQSASRASSVMSNLLEEAKASGDTGLYNDRNIKRADIASSRTKNIQDRGEQRAKEVRDIQSNIPGYQNIEMPSLMPPMNEAPLSKGPSIPTPNKPGGGSTIKTLPKPPLS